MESVVLSEDQVLYFRSWRGHLAGEGASDAGEVARALVGIQGQVLGPALLALSLRMEGRPTADSLSRLLLEEEPRSLVRTWGQRDTLHVYDAACDWCRVVAARGDWVEGGRRGDMPAEALLEKARQLVRGHQGLITRTDLFGLLPRAYVRDIRERVGSEREALRFGAGRLIWKLALEGTFSLGGKKGAEQLYAKRSDWFPELDWPDGAMDTQAANVSLLERYLGTYGAASPQDVAHFFGAKVSSARRWLASLEERGAILPVCCGGRRELWMLAADRESIDVSVPQSLREWPLRLLPGYDSLLMAHVDKSWTTPVAAERKAVWKKAAVVAPVILARGRIVATWSQVVKRKMCRVNIQPLSAWRSGKHLASVRREALAVAHHLGCDDVSVLLQAE